jgi:hypothetical protein
MRPTSLLFENVWFIRAYVSTIRVTSILTPENKKKTIAETLENKLTHSRSHGIVNTIVRKSLPADSVLFKVWNMNYGNTLRDNLFFIVTTVLLRLYCCKISWKY